MDGLTVLDRVRSHKLGVAVSLRISSEHDGGIQSSEILVSGTEDVLVRRVFSCEWSMEIVSGECWESVDGWESGEMDETESGDAQEEESANVEV